MKKFVLAASVLASALTPIVAGASVSRAASVPGCIVSLSPTATETLFAIGAGSQVKAVDLDANFPTTGLPSTRIDAFNPSVEAVASVCPVSKSHPSSKPDLVIISYDANSIKQQLTAAGIRVIEQDAAQSLSDVYAQINQLGTRTGHAANAAHVVMTMKNQIAGAIKSIPAHAGKVLTGYFELDQTYYSLTGGTFIGALMASLGIVNIANAAASPTDYGYPQLNSEYIVSSSPKLIFLADTVCCHQSAATVAARPGWSTISAVKNHHVIALNDDVASRWGPRVSLLIGQLATAVRFAYVDKKVWK